MSKASPKVCPPQKPLLVLNDSLRRRTEPHPRAFRGSRESPGARVPALILLPLVGHGQGQGQGQRQGHGKDDRGRPAAPLYLVALRGITGRDGRGGHGG